MHLEYECLECGEPSDHVCGYCGECSECCGCGPGDEFDADELGLDPETDITREGE